MTTQQPSSLAKSDKDYSKINVYRTIPMQNTNAKLREKIVASKIACDLTRVACSHPHSEGIRVTKRLDLRQQYLHMTFLKDTSKKKTYAAATDLEDAYNRVQFYNL